jgi:hypothetical protein
VKKVRGKKQCLFIVYHWLAVWRTSLPFLTFEHKSHPSIIYLSIIKIISQCTLHGKGQLKLKLLAIPAVAVFHHFALWWSLVVGFF